MKVLRQAAPLALVIVLLLVSISTTFAQTPQGDNEAPVQVLIRARPGSDLERQLQGGRELQIRNSRRGGFHLLSPERGVASLSYPDMESALRALGELQRDPDVLIAELEQFRELYWEPVGETEYERQTDWVHQINLPEAWNITTGRDSVVVAVIDSGVSPTHPDLADKLVDGYNAPYKNDDWADIDGHGTHVAGIIGASGSNGLGTVGVAMDVKIMPIRVVSDNGSISTAAIADSIYWAVDHGADVINLSLGATTPSQIEQDAVRHAYESGIPVLAASGNRASRISYPASYPEAISIGALDANGNRATFSSVVSRVDVAAPGVLIYSPHWGPNEGDTWSNFYKNQPVSGTSFAVAIASGVAALMRSIDPTLGPEDVRGLFVSTAVDSGEPGNEAGVGAGQIDAEAAVRMVAFDAMYDTWYTTDSLVADAAVERTWLWGEDPPKYYAYEPYTETQHGMRLVYYYDKSRMEITDPLAPRDGEGWYVTNGLLVNELITGQMQVGDADFVERSPAEVPIAGDPDDEGGPTYATFNGVLEAEPLPADLPISQTITRDGTVGFDSALISYGVVGAYLDETTGHRVANVFWDYLNSTGPIMTDDGVVEGRLFDPWFFATGLPVTEAYWAKVKVAGVVQDVLVQCFERRCLTYTPANPPGWRVEMGNVGLHYYSWRYGDDEPEPPAEPEPPEEPEPVPVPARGDVFFEAGFEVWGDAFTEVASREVTAEGMYIEVVEESGDMGMLLPRATFSDNIVAATVRLVGGNDGGAYCVVVRWEPLRGDHYRGCVTTGGDVSLVYLTTEGVATLVDEPALVSAERLAEGVEIAVVSQGSNFWLEVDGEVVGAAEHNGHAQGASGMIVSGVGAFLVTDFVIYEVMPAESAAE